MILKSISLCNFRQFRNTQKIEFSSGKQGKVTVVFGENGRGKTGIYRALLFGLYGVKKLSQDAHVEEKELYLVNYPEMQAREGMNKPVKASVSLDIDHAGKSYRIERSILGILESGEVLQEDSGVKLVIQDEDGNSKTINDPNEIDDVINTILDKGLREYFLFDGEKIERLTRASTEQRKEISNGIRKLLNIDALETSMNATDKLRKYLNREIEHRATGELARVVKLLRECEESIDSLEDECRAIETDSAIAEKELASADKKLSKIQEIRGLLDQRTRKEEERSSLKQEISDIAKEMKDHTAKTASLIIKRTTESVFRNIDQRKEKHELPSEIRRDLIERLLHEGLCICGTKLEPGSEEHRRILHWKNKATDSVTEDSMLNLWRLLSKEHNYFDDIDTETMSVLHKYALAKDNLRKVEHSLENLGEQIGTSPRSDASKLEGYRRNIVVNIAKKGQLLTTKSSELDILREECDQLHSRQRECEKEEGILSELSRRSEIASNTFNALKDIYEEFTGEARDMISSEATKFFQELLDEEGRKTLSDIVVDKDYSVQVFDRWQKPFLANISAGQRQIMSIAFIASLAKAASLSDILEMPWFMDTPFGRLSKEHRRNMIESVPNWCTQWILLATDTEFGRYESEILQATGSWSNFYILRGTGAGSTSIEKLNASQAKQLLREEAGE